MKTGRKRNNLIDKKGMSKVMLVGIMASLSSAIQQASADIIKLIERRFNKL